MNIIVPELQIGTITNEYGFYSLTLPKGNHILQINYLGYRTKKENIILNEDITKNFGLKQQSEILDEIILEENIETLNIKSPQMSVNRLAINTIKKSLLF